MEHHVDRETFDPIRWAQEALATFDRTQLTNPDGTINVEAYAQLDWLTKYLATAHRDALTALRDEAHRKDAARHKQADPTVS